MGSNMMAHIWIINALKLMIWQKNSCRRFSNDYVTETSNSKNSFNKCLYEYAAFSYIIIGTHVIFSI